MNDFKSYLIGEYKDKVKGFVAAEFKFTHSSNVKVDKKSEVPLTNDVIKVSLTFYDKDMNKLLTSTVSFENNLLTKTMSKKLVNISPKELENKFSSAKNDICRTILSELVEKRNELNDKIDSVQKYLGFKGIIPSEFKGESITIARNESPQPQHKVKFDM